MVVVTGYMFISLCLETSICQIYPFNLKKVLLRIRMKNDKKLNVGFSKTMDFNFLSVVSKLKTENMLVDDLLISF